MITRIYKGIEVYVNSTIKRLEYWQHYHDEGTFSNIIDFDN